MKRSRHITLLLGGTLAGGVLTGCSPEPAPPAGLSSEQSYLASTNLAGHTYTNNHYHPGLGYYHAPYHAWYPFPYNYYSAARGYYHGDRWTADPHQSEIKASQPTTTRPPPRSASGASSSTVRRSGFGSSLFSGGG